MKSIKKITAFLLSMIMLFTMAPTAFAGIGMDIEEAYEQCAALYPEFVDAVTSNGATETQIIAFLGDVQGYMLNLDMEITEDNFEEYFIEAIIDTMGKRKHTKVRAALAKAYPDAVVYGMDGIIAPEFVPLVETIKAILFGGGEEPTEEETEEITTAPTEEETEAPTEATNAPTEAPTQAPTEEETDAPTEAPTQAPTEAPTEKPTKAPVTGGPGGDDGDEGGDVDEGDEPVTEAPTQPTTQAPLFTDMNQAPWAEDAVRALVGMGVINGYGDGTFKPNNPVTRAEFSKMIVVASGRYSEKDKATYVSSFWDVPATQWHYTYVSAAYKFGFITGRSTTIFDPDSNITRGDLCLIVYRYIKSINPEFKAKTNADGTAITFADAANVPSWDVEAVNALYSNGIAPLRDSANNKFEPTLPATRAECAVIVYNATRAALGLK